MATIYKILGQSLPLSNSNVNIYTVPAGANAIISSISVCNQAATSKTFSIAVRENGSALTETQYVSFNTTVNQYDTVGVSLGITLGSGDAIDVISHSGNISFNVFGTEIR